MPKIQLRQDISSVWQSKNPVLLLGEFGVETDTNKFKIGDGVTDWNNLSYSVPTKTSDLVNDSGYINVSAVPTTLSQLINDSGYVTSSALNDKQDVLIAGSNITIENNVISAIGSGGSSSVNSVNGKVGTVVLSAHDVGALPDSTFIPVKTSDIVNDSGFITLTSVNNGTVTINQGGVQKGTFTLNQSGNATIDLDLGGQASIDQTFNGASQNAQSGVAIQGKLSTNYQSKLVSGTNIKTVNNTSLLGSGNIDTSEIFVAEYDVTSYADILNAYNTKKFLVLKDTLNDLCIPLTGYDGSAFYFVSPILIGYNNIKVLYCDSNGWDYNENTYADLAALNTKVSKSGDTMTGALTINVDTQNQLVLVNPYITKGTNPSERKYYGLYFNDSQNLPADDYKDTRLGCIETDVNTNGTVTTSVSAMQNVADGTAEFAALYLSVSSSGAASCSFPYTTCCDGQWISLNATIASDISVNGTTNLTYTLSGIPSDGHMYEVLLSGQVNSGASSGNYASLNVSSDRITVSCRMCTSRSRTAATHTGGGNIILPITSSRKIYVDRDSSWNGTITLWLRGYRRIGTNS